MVVNSYKVKLRAKWLEIDKSGDLCELTNRFNEACLD